MQHALPWCVTLCADEERTIGLLAQGVARRSSCVPPGKPSEMCGGGCAMTMSEIQCGSHW